MSLLFFDGFDGYDSGGDLTNFGGWYSANTGAISLLNASPRIGSSKYIHFAGDSNNSAQIAFDNDQAGNTIVKGFAFRLTTRSDASNPFIHILDSSNTTQLQLYINTYNKLVAINPTTGTLVTGTTTLAYNVWYFLELRIKVASSGGIYDCKLDGTTEFTFTGNTQAQATNSVKIMRFNSYAIYYDIDDLYILNTLGSSNNTYLGDIRCLQLPLVGDTTAGFTRNTGTANYQVVDDPLGAPDDTTTYVSAATSGTRDECTLTDVSGTNSIFGVKVNTRAQKDTVNAKSFKHGIKTGANQQHATVSLSVGYTNYQNIYETSDGAGTAWTPTTLNAAVSTIEVV